MRKLVMILVMMMVAFGSFAKDFEYKSDDEEWKYYEKSRTLHYKAELLGTEYDIWIYDVSEDEAWKIINGEEFPTFAFQKYESDEYVSRWEMPCRDYSKMGRK